MLAHLKSHTSSVQSMCVVGGKHPSVSFVCTAADAMLGVGPREAGDGLGGYDNQALGSGDTQASVLSAPSSHLFSSHLMASVGWLGAVLGTFGGPMPNSGINYTVTGLAQIDDTSFASCADLVKIWTLAAA